MWLCESVGKLKGVGHQKKTKMKELSIHKIADLKLHFHHHSIPKVPIWGFSQIYDIALQYLPGNPPYSFKDHRKARNPYLSRYGERWVEKLKLYTAMPKLCCITYLIRFMTNEAEKRMKGSFHEDNLFTVHNALVLLTAKETINWIRKNGYLHRWLLPPQRNAGWESLRRPSCW